MISSFASLKGKIALLGGSFDPVHNAHLALAELAKTKLALDQVIFIPVKQNPLRDSTPLASDADRLEMLRLSLKNKVGLEYSDIEIKQTTTVSYTVDTLRKIKAENKDAQFYLIFGTDQIEKLHLWKEYKELFKLANLVVVRRNDTKIDEFAKLNATLSAEEVKALSSNFLEFNFPVSSTQIRQYLNNSNFKLARQYLPIGVFDWIVQNNLYK